MANEGSSINFSFPVLTKIVGRPTYAAIDTLRRECYANATCAGAAFGRLGLLGTIMPDDEFLRVNNGVAFIPPVDPGNQIVPADRVGDNVLNERNFAVQRKLYLTYENMLINQRIHLLQAVETKFLDELEDPIMGFGLVSAKAILAYLFTTYGKIGPADLEANVKLLESDWDVTGPIADVWARVKKCRSFATAGNRPLDDHESSVPDISGIRTEERDLSSPDSFELNDTVFHSEMYHSRQEPFRSFPCYPRLIHLAQASNVDIDTLLLNMTVSFALDFKACPCAIPTVIFGGPIVDGNELPEHMPHYSSFRSESHYGVVRVAVIPERLPWQFNFTSDKSDGIYQSDWIYHVPITNVKGGLQTYWYRIVVAEEENPRNCRNGLFTSSSSSTRQRRSLRGSGGYYLGETKTYMFQTPPLPGQPTSLALVGDLGQTMNSARTLWNVYAQTSAGRDHCGDIGSHVCDDLDDPPVSQLLIAGDLSYADSDPRRWVSFLELIEPLARSLPIHVVAGNHEIECDTRTNDIFVPYEHWFRAPNQIQPAAMEPVSLEYKKTLWNHSCSAPSVFQGIYNYGNSFYSYQHGLVYVIVLNSYTNCTRGSAQYEWLKGEFDRYTQNHHRQTTPWLLISFHAPLYTTFLGHVNEQEATQMKVALQPLFLNYGVNIVISGHDHAYMRTYPLAYDQVDAAGLAPVYLTLGAGGNREGHSRGYRNPFKKEKWVATRSIDDFGYGKLFVSNATHALFKWVRDYSRINDGFEDVVWLTNPYADV